MTDNQPKSRFQRLLDNQIARFILSAGIGFVVDVTSFFVFYKHLFTQKRYHVFGYSVTSYVVSLALSFFLGVMVNFLITKFLVFTESTLPPTQQFFRFVGVAILGFFANLAVLSLFIKYLDMDPPIARPLAALSLFFASFFVHKFFSFNVAQHHQHAPSTNSK